MPDASTSFRDFEFQGWQKVAGRYHDTFAGATVQSVEALLDAGEVRAGTRVLDVACGPGYVAGAAAVRHASVLGLDFSSEMVAEARRRYPGVEFRAGDAEALPLPDQSFDAVVMNFGMLHLGRPELAVQEAYRVLRPEGRYAFTVWETPDQTVGFGIVISAIQRYGDMNVALPPGPPFFRFSDRAESARVLREAGFRDIQNRMVPQTWRLPAPGALFDIMMNASVRNAALLSAQKPDVLGRIRADITAAVGARQSGTTFDLPMPAVLFSGVK